MDNEGEGGRDTFFARTVNGGAPQGSCAGVQIYTVGIDDMEADLPPAPVLVEHPREDPDWSTVRHPPATISDMSGEDRDEDQLSPQPGPSGVGGVPSLRYTSLGPPGLEARSLELEEERGRQQHITDPATHNYLLSDSDSEYVRERSTHSASLDGSDLLVKPICGTLVVGIH